MKDIILETERMILRAFNWEDVEDMYILGSIPEIIKYVGNSPLQSMDEAKEYLKNHHLNDYDTYGYGRFACILKETGKIIGFSGVKYFPQLNENELGYRFLPETWGKGFASEAAGKVIAFATQELGLSRLVSLIHPDNSGSKNVVLKQGFAYEKNVVFPFFEEIEVELFTKQFS